jgi:hypothetical protein
MSDFAIQVRASSLGELLEDAAKADEAIIYADNDELARLLWERIGNADVAEAPPQIGEELFYLVGLRGQGEGPAKVEDVVVYRCVASRGNMAVIMPQQCRVSIHLLSPLSSLS